MTAGEPERMTSATSANPEHQMNTNQPPKDTISVEIAARSIDHGVRQANRAVTEPTAAIACVFCVDACLLYVRSCATVCTNVNVLVARPRGENIRNACNKRSTQTKRDSARPSL